MAPPSTEPGSCSRLSWADEVEAVEASPSATRAIPFELPPLAATAHAALVLQASCLDPDAEPFIGFPGGSEARLHLSDTKGSFSGSEHSLSACGKVPARPRRLRRRRRPRGVIGAEQRPSSPPPQRRLASIVVHPPRMSVEPDADGFRAVESSRRWRRAPAPRRPVPADLVGKCFNCFAGDHIKAEWQIAPSHPSASTA